MCEVKSPVLLAVKLLILRLLLFAYNVAAISSSAGNGNGAELDQFKYCLRQSERPNLSECVGRTAISFLQRFDESENLTLAEDFVSTKDEKAAGRSLVNFLDADPVDFRGILENAGAVLGQRSLEWHMDALYPGLMFKIGPTASANSVAEFVLDPTIDERHFGFEEPSTARLLAKQYLLPFLLGFKFNLVALVPLLFAAIALLLKKSLLLAKLAIFVSSILGVGGAIGTLGSLGGGGFGGFGGLGGLGGIFRPPPPILGHGHALDVAPPPLGASGYFPGKTSIYNHNYEVEEYNNNSPYKRTDRKVNFDKTRDYATPRATVPSTPTSDRFYEYEKQVMLQDRSGKVRSSSGKLGPSAAFEEDDKHSFKTSDRLGWKVVDIRA